MSSRQPQNDISRAASLFRGYNKVSVTVSPVLRRVKAFRDVVSGPPVYIVCCRMILCVYDAKPFSVTLANLLFGIPTEKWNQ